MRLWNTVWNTCTVKKAKALIFGLLGIPPLIYFPFSFPLGGFTYLSPPSLLLFHFLLLPPALLHFRLEAVFHRVQRLGERWPFGLAGRFDLGHLLPVDVLGLDQHCLAGVVVALADNLVVLDHFLMSMCWI